jgi:T-complex protein 1 subunit gamma
MLGGGRHVTLGFIPSTLSLQALNEKAKSIQGVDQWPYRAVSKALEVIPRTLIQNCGANTIRTITALRVSSVGSFRRIVQ